MRQNALAEKTKDRVEIFLDKLASLDRGELAVLRRNASCTLAEARNAAGLFYRLLPPGVSERDEEIYFLVATLYGLNKHKSKDDFGATMRTVKIKTGREGIDRRMAILLDSEFDLIDGFRSGGGEMAYRLRQCVKLASGHEVGVDWGALLRDLLQWSRPGKRVRKQWARSYYGKHEGEAAEAAREIEGGNARC